MSFTRTEMFKFRRKFTNIKEVQAAVNREAYKRGQVITGQAVPLIGAKETLKKVLRGLLAVASFLLQIKSAFIYSRKRI